VKLLFRLAVLALMANAGWRIGSAYLAHYQFRDAVREAALTQALDDDGLTDRVFELAESYDVPIEDESFSIRRAERRTMIDGTYTRPIQLLPGWEYSWPFEWSIDGFVTVPPKLNELDRR
jgi:hypothetical protein